MKKTESAGFWEQGFSNITHQLAEEEKSRLGQVKQLMKQATDPEAKVRLKKQIDAIKAEFKAKRESAKHSLFVKP